MKTLVCGGRGYTDKRKVFETLGKLAPTVIIHGGCISGADQFAARWCAVTHTPQRVYQANWELHGRAAGPIRNQQMIDEEKPEIVVAFAGGRGTADMVARAKTAGIAVMEILDEEA